MQLKDFQKALEHKVDLVLPDEPKVFNAAANSGKPLAQTHARAKVCKALRKVAGDIRLPDSNIDMMKTKGKGKGKDRTAAKGRKQRKPGLFGLFKRSCRQWRGWSNPDDTEPPPPARDEEDTCRERGC